MAAFLRSAIAALSIAGLAAVSTACKQGEGDVCQVSDDCEDGLVCNMTTGRCQRIGGGDIDAAFQVDAREDLDAGTPDAAPEVDAMPDAMPEPDGMIDGGGGGGGGGGP